MPSNVALNKLASDGQEFHLVFLDPPYAKQHIVSDMKKMLKLALLGQDAIVVAETDDETELGQVEGFKLMQEKHLGKTIVRFYRKEN